MDNNEIENEIQINQKITDSQNPCFTKFIASSVGYLFKGENKSLHSYMILELASKGNVLDYIKKNEEGLEDKLCKLFFAKLLIIVKDLHKIGICHRDLKLDNFLFDENFNIKLSDFGFSSFIKKYKNGKKKKQTEYLGTSHYIAPEILMEIPYDGEKADIFSLGILLFSLITGFNGLKGAKTNHSSFDINEKLYTLLNNNKIESFWNLLEKKMDFNFSPEFKKLFIKMVAMNPDERPTIGEIYNYEWMNDINKLNEKEFKIYEQDFIDELKSRNEILNLLTSSNSYN